MKRSDLTEKLLDIKREKGWTWKYICEKIGGYSEVLIVGAILGQTEGDALADAPARARHERHLAAQIVFGDPHVYGQTRSMNFCGGRSPHCDCSPSSADSRFEPFFAFSRSVSDQCSWTRPHGSDQ